MSKFIILFLLSPVLASTQNLSVSNTSAYLIEKSETVLSSTSQNSSACMIENETIIKQFYTAFQQKDYNKMNSFYDEAVVFNDPVFENLDYLETTSMWEILIKNGKDLQLTFDNVQATPNGGTAEWQARYTFGKNKVVNNVKANFVIENGKIIKHTDSFSFQKWSGQALGFMGKLLGWTNFLKSSVQKKARKNLERYIEKSME